MQSRPVLTLTGTAAFDLQPHCFVTTTGAWLSAGGNALGATRSAAASGAAVPVDVIGTTVVEAGAAVAAGAAVESDAQGRAVPQSTGVVVGRALQAAAGPGELIEVLLIPN